MVWVSNCFVPSELYNFSMFALTTFFVSLIHHAALLSCCLNWYLVMINKWCLLWSHLLVYFYCLVSASSLNLLSSESSNCPFTNTSAGWDHCFSYLDRIACIYAFLSSCNCQCHHHLFPHCFGCCWRLLGSFLCLCNSFLHWGHISCCFCYFNCNNISNYSCSCSYRYIFLSIYFSFYFVSFL